MPVHNADIAAIFEEIAERRDGLWKNRKVRKERKDRGEHMALIKPFASSAPSRPLRSIPERLERNPDACP